MAILKHCKALSAYSGYHWHAPSKVFSFGFKPAFWWTSINRYHGFSRFGPEQILSPFLEHSEEHARVSAVSAIFCYRIRHSFMSRLRGVRIGWVFVGGNSNNRHTHTVSYNHISFLNARSQLVWVLASFGFYSITWRMISRSAGYEIHFRKQPLFRGNFLPCRCDIFRFFEFILDPLQYVVHGFRVFIQSNK